jgi:hypothetical protein
MVDSVMKVNQVFFFLERAQGETLSFWDEENPARCRLPGASFTAKSGARITQEALLPTPSTSLYPILKRPSGLH